MILTELIHQAGRVAVELEVNKQLDINESIELENFFVDETPNIDEKRSCPL